jgi:DNA-directed RNA polymerase specialized sigma24 family protein
VQGLINIEQQLLTHLAAGDHKATSQIYKQHFPYYKWLVSKTGGSQSDAADLFQEAMVVLFGKAQEKEFRLTCSIGTYLMAVSKHLWYKRLQKQSRDPVFLKENIGTDEDEGGIG